MNALASLSAVALHRALPEGHELGAVVAIEGSLYCVTQAEIDRIKSMPTADEIKLQVAAIQKYFPTSQP